MPQPGPSFNVLSSSPDMPAFIPAEQSGTKLSLAERVDVYSARAETFMCTGGCRRRNRVPEMGDLRFQLDPSLCDRTHATVWL